MHLRPRISIRRARLSDVPQLIEVEHASWEAACDPEDMFTTEQFEAHIRNVGDYFFVAEERQTGRLVGYVSALRVDIPVSEVEERVTTWYALTGDGEYTGHQPNGQCLFGGSLGVIPESQRSGIGDRLIEREFREIVRHGMTFGALGGRLPGMAAYLAEHPESNPEHYFQLTREDGKPYDPELRFYADDFEVRKLLPEYFKDRESCNNGVLLVWRNPFLGSKLLKPLIAAQVFKAICAYYRARART
ncbi:MAG TPA: GNAT family N-acetyltransferase [Candidatus Saccharimonadales bacterium]|nr:GNAT family N-acetyltransferase [Candidatus Saccharimonadales bacterium]